MHEDISPVKTKDNQNENIVLKDKTPIKLDNVRYEKLKLEKNELEKKYNLLQVNMKKFLEIENNYVILDKELQAKLNEIAKLKELNSEQVKEIKNLKDNISENDFKIDKLNININNLNKKIDLMERKDQNLKTEKKDLESKLRTQEKDYKEQLRNLEKVNEGIKQLGEKKDIEIKNLKNDISVSNGEIKQRDIELLIKNNELKKINKDIQIKDDELKKITADVKMKDNTIKNITDDNFDMKDKIAEADKKIKSLEGEKKSLSSKFNLIEDELNNVRKTSTDEITKLKDEMKIKDEKIKNLSVNAVERSEYDKKVEANERLINDIAKMQKRFLAEIEEVYEKSLELERVYNECDSKFNEIFLDKKVDSIKVGQKMNIAIKLLIENRNCLCKNNKNIAYEENINKIDSALDKIHQSLVDNEQKDGIKKLRKKVRNLKFK